MVEKLDWLWENISGIYIEFGLDYICNIEGLTIISNDNYFDCTINGDSFRISIEHSIFGKSKIYFTQWEVGKDPDFFIQRLRPIVRNWKINSII
jgi:hypothetical protein